MNFPLPLTFRCNNNCISCIMDMRQAANITEPSFEELKRTIDALSEKVDLIEVTGGEPTLHKHFIDIIRYIRERHPEKRIFLLSNGRKLADYKFAKQFVDAAKTRFRVAIPLYSHNASVHDSITRAKGSWEQTIAGIKNLLKLGANVELRILVEKINFRELPETAHFIAENFAELERVVFINLKYTGNAFINRKQVFIPYSMVVPYVQNAIDVLQKAKIRVLLFHFPFCILEKRYWPFVAGVTKELYELTYAPQCELCKLKDKCCMIWKSYVPLAGFNEFKPILR